MVWLRIKLHYYCHFRFYNILIIVLLYILILSWANNSICLAEGKKHIGYFSKEDAMDYRRLIANGEMLVKDLKILENNKEIIDELNSFINRCIDDPSISDRDIKKGIIYIYQKHGLSLLFIKRFTYEMFDYIKLHQNGI